MKTLLSTFLGLFMILSMSAQVGVNNPTPEQALDVKGKVKLTDDATAPTAGTMRYDATSSDFEGFNGSQWNSFTQSKSSGLPSNPVPVFGYSLGGSSANNQLRVMTFKRWADGSLFDQVPADKYLIVTSISFAQVFLNEPIADDDTYGISIGPVTGINGQPDIQNGSLFLRGKGYINNVDRESAQSPIFILRPGQYLNFTNYTANSITMIVRGFLVDDLNY